MCIPQCFLVQSLYSETSIFASKLFPSDDAIVRSRLSEALDAVLNRAQEPAKSKKIQHANAKNAVLFEAVNLIIHFQG